MRIVVVTRDFGEFADGNWSRRRIAKGELLFLEEWYEHGVSLVNDGSNSFRLASAYLEDVP